MAIHTPPYQPPPPDPHDASTHTPDILIPTRSLSPREVEVVSLLADGLRVAEVGEKLGIALGTAEEHVFNAKQKKRVRTIGGLVGMAFRDGEVK